MEPFSVQLILMYQQAILFTFRIGHGGAGIVRSPESLTRTLPTAIMEIVVNSLI